MINSKFVRFTLVVYVSHKVNEAEYCLFCGRRRVAVARYRMICLVLVTDIILNITSQEHLIFSSLHIGSRLFELFSKEVRVTKQPGMPLKYQRRRRYSI